MPGGRGCTPLRTGYTPCTRPPRNCRPWTLAQYRPRQQSFGKRQPELDPRGWRAARRCLRLGTGRVSLQDRTARRVEYGPARASARVPLEVCLGTAGISGAKNISTSPGRRTTPAGGGQHDADDCEQPPGQHEPPRGHAPPANRINPRRVNSALVRINLRTRLFRVGRGAKRPRPRQRNSIPPGSADALAVSSQPPAPGLAPRVDQ